MQDCAATHYRAFIKAADCLSAVRQNLSSVNTHLKGMLEVWPGLPPSAPLGHVQHVQLCTEATLSSKLGGASLGCRGDTA